MNLCTNPLFRVIKRDETQDNEASKFRIYKSHITSAHKIRVNRSHEVTIHVWWKVLEGMTLYGIKMQQVLLESARMWFLLKKNIFPGLFCLIYSSNKFGWIIFKFSFFPIELKYTP